MTSAHETIGYFVSRFPEISETFILDEMLALQETGTQVQLFPLIRQEPETVHQEAKALINAAHYAPFFSRDVKAARHYWRKHAAAAYRQVWHDAIAGNRASWGFLSRAMVVVPKATYFARKCQELGVTHIHAHWATHPGLAAYCVHKLTTIPYSLTIHAHDLYVARPMLEQKIRNAKFVVTISDFNRKLIDDLYGNSILDKVHVIHCGVDTSVFTPTETRPSEAPPVIACIASLEAYKGHRYLFDALSRLKQDHVAFQCLCVGEGRRQSDLARQLQRLGLHDDVKLLGAQPRREVLKILHAASLVVQPSIVAQDKRMEGIPVALMEALAMELPAVATDISGVAELIEHERTGLLVPEKDSAALAASITRLFQDTDLAGRLGKAGREKVLADFDLRKNVAQLQKLFTTR